MHWLGPVRPAVVVLAAVAIVGCGASQGSAPLASTIPATSPPASQASDPPGATTWQPGPEAPQPLIEQATAVHDGRIWIAGGLTEAGTAVDRVDILDPATGTWSDGPPLPLRIHHAALVSDGQDLWLIGGYIGDSFGAPTEAVRRLPGGDPAGRWEDGPPLPTQRAAGAAVWDGERIVYGGGIGPGVLADIVYVLGTDGFAPVTRLSRAREHLAAATDGAGTTWFLGGRQGDLASNLSRVDVVVGERAEEAGEMPTARGGVAAFWWPSLGACLLGGESPTVAHREVECIAADGSTTTLPPLTVPRHGFGAVVVDGVVYAVLGGAVPGLSVSSSVETLVLPD